MPDVWGQIYRDHWAGIVEPHVIERDDGREHEFESAAAYFEAPRSDPEREFLDVLRGPVLDLGAGPGSYTLYLEARGLEVTATDASPGAVEVCLARGCRAAHVLDLRSVTLEPSVLGSIIVMGNTLGAQQTPESLPTLLSSLRRGVNSGGLDPLDTEDPRHHEYSFWRRCSTRSTRRIRDTTNTMSGTGVAAYRRAWQRYDFGIKTSSTSGSTCGCRRTRNCVTRRRGQGGN